MILQEVSTNLTVSSEDYKGTTLEKSFETTQLDAEVKDGLRDGKRQKTENNKYLEKVKNRDRQ